jgi:tetrahydromethanopterin S-methyltransferase subunit H
MYGLEQYEKEARKAGLIDRLKAEKFEEIRDAARDLTKAQKALSDAVVGSAHFGSPEACMIYLRLEQDVEDYQFVLDRFIQRAAEGDL